MLYLGAPWFCLLALVVDLLYLVFLYVEKLVPFVLSFC
jgi:hypothetical protein